jgi:preprotein translocase subunit SecD
VQLPGVKEPERAVSLIGKTALLEFKLVDSARLDEALSGNVPEGYKIYSYDGKPLLLKEKPELTGRYIKDAHVRFDPQRFDTPYVALSLNREGAKKFAKTTRTHVGERLAIVLDGKVKSAPVIKTPILDGNCVIEGDFTLAEANDLAIVLRAGALPCPLKIIEKKVIGPTLGADSIRKSVSAALFGAVAVLLFMAIYYRFWGLVADLALLFNVVLILGALSCLEATLTLPGIAGIILTMGMSVDANVLIFERMKEELRARRTLILAIENGYRKAFSTIFDANITTLICAFILFGFGEGPIKGFAITLSIGILASMFTALLFTKFVLKFALFPQRA